MRLTRPFDDVFATGSHIRVLRALDSLPEGVGASGREVARRAGVSAPTAREVLAGLVAQGIVSVKRGLKTASYRLNRDHILSPTVRDLFARERSLPKEFAHDVATAIRKEPDVKEAYLFGSAARGDMLPTSDIDIAIVSRKAAPEGSAALDTVSTKYGNRVNLTRLRRGRGSGLRERIRVEGKALPLRRSRPTTRSA